MLKGVLCETGSQALELSPTQARDGSPAMHNGQLGGFGIRACGECGKTRRTQAHAQKHTYAECGNRETQAHLPHRVVMPIPNTRFRHWFSTRPCLTRINSLFSDWHRFHSMPPLPPNTIEESWSRHMSLIRVSSLVHHAAKKKKVLYMMFTWELRIANLQTALFCGCLLKPCLRITQICRNRFEHMCNFAQCARLPPLLRLSYHTLSLTLRMALSHKASRKAWHLRTHLTNPFRKLKEGA